jgi:tetratricopeptide (TPR) repeat protein
VERFDWQDFAYTVRLTDGVTRRRFFELCLTDRYFFPCKLEVVCTHVSILLVLATIVFVQCCFIPREIILSTVNACAEWLDNLKRTKQNNVNMGGAWSFDVRERTQNKAEKYEQIGNVSMVQSVYKLAIEENPSISDDLYGDKAMILQRMGETPAAFDAYKEAVSLNPWDCSLIYNRGVLLERVDYDDMALHHFDEALHLVQCGYSSFAKLPTPRVDTIKAMRQRIYEKKARAFEEIHRYEDALHAYDKALEQKSVPPKQLYIKKIHLLRRNVFQRREEAIQVCDEAIHHYPKDSFLYDTKAGLCIMTSQLQKALKTLNQGIKEIATADNSRLWVSKAQVLNMMGWNEEAIQACVEGRKHSPQDWSLIWAEREVRHSIRSNNSDS